MAFIDTQFPTEISYGSKGGPGYSTKIVKLASGYEKRNINWSQARYAYDVSFGVKTYAQLETLIAFFHVAQGMANGFRYKDWIDYKSCAVGSNIAATDQTIGTGDDSTTVFQLVKVYSTGGTTRTRNIYKPIASTVVIAVDGSANTTDWSLNASTGQVTFTSALASAKVVTAGFEFDVPCRFDTDELSTSLDDYNIGSTDVPVVEIRI